MRKHLVVGLLALVIAVGIACAESETAPTPTPSPTVAPAPEPTSTPISKSALEILEASMAAMQDAESLHFDIDVQVKLVVQGQPLDVPLTFVGDFQAPDRSKGTLSLAIPFFSIEIEVISIGSTTYTKDPQTGEWVVALDETPFFEGPVEFIGVEELDKLLGLTLVGEETLDGVTVYHIMGNLAAETPGKTGVEAEIEFWVGVEDSLVRQVVSTGAFELGDETFFEGLGVSTGDASLTLKFSEFGKSLSIEAPALDSAPAPADSSGNTNEIDTLRQLVLDYQAAFNSYDEDRVLSYLEEGHRVERESAIRQDIGQVRLFNVKLGVSEDSPPQMTGPGEGEVFMKVREPLGTRRVRMAFRNLDGEWKITHAEEVS